MLVVQVHEQQQKLPQRRAAAAFAEWRQNSAAAFADRRCEVSLHHLLAQWQANAVAQRSGRQREVTLRHLLGQWRANSRQAQQQRLQQARALHEVNKASYTVVPLQKDCVDY